MQRARIYVAPVHYHTVTNDLGYKTRKFENTCSPTMAPQATIDAL